MTSLAARARALLLVALLLALQPAAPLLHAHAAGDPRAVASSGLHLPGLEGIERDALRSSLDVPNYPLVEEGELSRRDVLAPVAPGAQRLASVLLPCLRAGSELPPARGVLPRSWSLPPPAHGPPRIG